MNCVVISKSKRVFLICHTSSLSNDFLLVGTTMVLTKKFSSKTRVGIENSQLLPINPDFRSPFFLLIRWMFLL